jgi:hypothetical protein
VVYIFRGKAHRIQMRVHHRARPSRSTATANRACDALTRLDLLMKPSTSEASMDYITASDKTTL